MLERSKKRKSNLDEIVSEGLKFISKTELTAGQERKNGLRSNPPRRSLNETSNSFNDVNMTRGTRARRPRITVFETGYCALCSLPYNNVEDHIQSKKHQKLIGQDANYIAVNGYIHSDVGIETLLSLNGIDAIGFGNEFLRKPRNRTMPKSKNSAMSESKSETKRSSSVSPTRNDATGHHLRSRKSVNYNYMTPPLEEDHMAEKPDLEPPKSPVRLQYTEYRELRSSTRALAKLTSVQSKEETEVWNSGRPKRACISRQKRISADERLMADNEAFYKVEVLSNKLRSSVSRERELPKAVKTNKENDNEKLIVKFKKLRSTELTQLNNEATNFLFPKRDESSEEDEEPDNHTSNSEEMETEMSCSETEDKKPLKCEFDDEISMDSISSEGQRRRKRRSHAEAFILDNQKYYKFETPGSRLRYHGSYLSPIPMKSNGDCFPKFEREDSPPIAKKEVKEKLDINLDEYKFSFESVPVNQPWYQAFTRIDRGEQKYQFTKNYHWDDFVMPYRLPHVKALDPNLCLSAHKELLDSINNMMNDELDVTETTEPESSCVEDTTVKETTNEITEDEYSKLSCVLDDTESNVVVVEAPLSPKAEPMKPLPERIRLPRRRKGILLSPTSVGRNPRKSPRQHASTLAILSLLQKKKRGKNSPLVSEANQSLEQIPEEQEEEEEEPVVPGPVHTSTPAPKPKAAPTPKRAPPKVKKKDYFALAEQIEEELDTALDFDLDFEIDENTEQSYVEFKNSSMNVTDILTIYEETRQKETETSCRRFFNGTPGRRGKRKKNLTGWPKTKKRRLLKLGGDNENTIHTSVHNIDSEDDEDEFDDGASIVSINDKNNTRVTGNETDTEEISRVDNKIDLNDRVLCDSELQPFVYVKKLDSVRIRSTVRVNKCSPKNKRTSKRRPIIVSPKSPRILRKPRGRWYRER